MNPRPATARALVVVSLLGLGTLAACGDEGSTTPGTAGSAGVPATSTSGHPTPKPTTTPASPSTPAEDLPPPAGTAFDGEDISAADSAALQQSVDEGHQPWRLDVRSVAQAFMQSRLGWQTADYQLADPHTVEATNTADGRIVSLQLRQPAREGEGGIWVVVGGVWIS